MIWWLPIEPLEQRYTAQMDRWVQTALNRTGRAYVPIYGTKEYAEIENGEWLDTIGSARWKYSQLTQLTELCGKGTIQSGDTILCGDVWFCGIEGIKLISELMGLNIRFAGWHYAGCFDSHDLYAKTLSRWGPKYELSLLEGVFDAVAFGSRFHSSFVSRHACPTWQSVSCGLAWDHDEVSTYQQPMSVEKNKTVVFNHRWSNEKRWYEFCYLARLLAHKSDWSFVYSTNGLVSETVSANCSHSNITIVQHGSKSAYYDWLSKQGIVWSGADQETFGYSFMEAVALGLRVVAPNRAAYPDHFTKAGLNPLKYLYGVDDPFGCSSVLAAMNAHETNADAGLIPSVVSSQYQYAIEEFLEAI